jgi:hypothetical protein
MLECEYCYCGECKATVDEAAEVYCIDRLEVEAELEEEEEENMNGLDPAFKSWTEVNSMFV